MPVKEALPPILRGEDAADLSPESRARLDAIADEAAHDRQLPYVRDECANRLKQPGASLAVEYLLADVCARNGEMERSNQTLLTLGEKLAAARQWEPLAAVADRALALERTQAGARLLVKAHEGIGRDPDRVEALERAWSILPDDLELALLLAVRLGEGGQDEVRRDLLTELMPRFAEQARYTGLEEAALEFVEHEHLDGLVRLMTTLPKVAEQGAHPECIQLLDIAFPPVARAERAGEVLPSLRELIARTAERQGAAAVEAFRAPLVEAIRQGPARTLPDAAPVFQRSEIEDPTKPLIAGLERFDAIAALPPGSTVHHDSFGAGRVTLNDGDTVAIDFGHARGHKMPYAAARRTLTAIAEDDLRLLRISRPDELKRLRAEEPAEIIWRGLKAVGGAGDAQKLKVFLVGSQLVPAPEWTTFWRKAKAAVERDRRIDSSRAFEQVYRLATASVAGAAEVAPPLPSLGPRKPVKANLATLRKFLSQHPSAEQALAGRFGKYVERAVLDPEGDRVDRARAGLYFARWYPDRRAEWTEVLRTLWDQGLSISDLTSEEEQLALLEVSHASGVESDAILSGLDSRFSAVQRAATAYREHLDVRGREDMRHTLLQRATRYPAAALRLIDMELSQDEVPQDVWRMFAAALALIEERPKASTAEKIVRWLEPGGAFDRKLAQLPAPIEIQLQLRVLLRQWRSSDRYLFPALEAAERVGLADEVETVRAARRRKSEKLFDKVGETVEAADVPMMTRATYERMQKELEQLERELRTTIPATIQKARELGDLKENAEYHSAKLKQANVSRVVASLQQRLLRARFVDEIEHKEGVIGLGTEVVLESEGQILTYWILGEGEHHHGDHVVSYQATVGRALMGRAIGDEIELGEGEQRRRYRVVSIERKLPPSETVSA